MDKVIMSINNLENISVRLACCSALLDTINNALRDDDPFGEAVWGARDLLDCIRRDFQADIDCAELEAQKETGAV